MARDERTADDRSVDPSTAARRAADRSAAARSTADRSAVDGRAGATEPTCSESGCADGASFFRYDAESRRWRPICALHARHLHPSLEVHAWLESGYMRPVELGRPAGPPTDPGSGTDSAGGADRGGGRQAAFRAVVEEAMGWSE